MYRFFFLLLLAVGVTGCSSIGLQPQAGIGVTAVETATKTSEEIRAAVPSDPDCERDARIFYFVTHLPAVSEVYQLDLYLARKSPNASEPKRLGACVLNPFNPQNIAAQEPKHE